MSDGSLSQDEIDALLAGTDQLMGGGGMGASTQVAPQASAETLSDTEKSSLLDALRAATDAAASGLKTIISSGVGVGMMKADLMRAEEVRAELNGKLVQVTMNLQDGVTGENVFVLPESGAVMVSNLTMGQSGGELTNMALKALTDTWNTMYGAAASSLSARLGRGVRFTDARAESAHSSTELSLPGGAYLMRVSYSLKIDGQGALPVAQVMSFKAARDIINLAMGIGADMNFGGGGPASFGMPQMQDMGPSAGQIGVANVQLPQLSAGYGQQATPHNIGMLMDVQMQLSVELGRAKKKISEILGLGEGSIIELDKLAGEPVDVLVNGKLIAKGEVVVIDENFGVRVTEIIAPNSRVELNA